jgi:hypothetical protein
MMVVTEAAGVEEAAAAVTAARENFTKRSVRNAKKSVKFHSNQAEIVLSSVKIVFQSKRAAVANHLLFKKSPATVLSLRVYR